MSDITPSDEQAKAIKSIIEWYRAGGQEFYLAGFAGVGKSTVANIAIKELQDKYRLKNIKTAAYTGKAASVLKKKGVHNAQTIHSLIYSPHEDENTGELHFSLDEAGGAADADLIVLDEVSMVNREICEDIRSFGKKILVMGDPGQLPPVSGEGDFTNREPDVFLREIHRQAAESPIIELATLARQGKPLLRGYSKDGVRVLPLNKETQPLIYREETQPICGLNRVRWAYNARIRKLRGFSGELPQPGERVVCCKNNKDEGLFNGGLGRLLAIEVDRFGKYIIDVEMEDLPRKSHGLKVDPYLFKRNFDGGVAQRMKLPKGGKWLDEFDLAYLLTCHKAQGSQFPDVTVIDDSGCFREHRNHWMYTALTRSETGLTVLLR